MSINKVTYKYDGTEEEQKKFHNYSIEWFPELFQTRVSNGDKKKLEIKSNSSGLMYPYYPWFALLEKNGFDPEKVKASSDGKLSSDLLVALNGLKQELNTFQINSSDVVETASSSRQPYQTMSSLHEAMKHEVVKKVHDNSDQNIHSELSLDQKNAEKNKFDFKQIKQGDHEIIFKKFTKESYNGPTTHDFARRLDVIFESIIKYIDDSKINSNNKKLIEFAKSLTLEAIEKINIDPISLDELLNQEERVINEIQNAQNHIRTFVSYAINAIEKDKNKHSDVIRKIEQSESKLTEQKGRPNFVNHYLVNDVTRVSAARVVGQAIPSTERAQKKLPNFAECDIGYYDSDNKYVSQFRGYRHSSYPPIKIEDKFQRAQFTAIIAKEMLTELTRNKISEDNLQLNSAEPIEIHLSSLALLTPIPMDSQLRRNESEQRQLKESYNALMMYNNRIIDVEVDGEIYKIKPNINIINTPFNLLESFRDDSLEKKINKQGMNRFISQIESELFFNPQAPQGVSLLIDEMINNKTESLKVMKESLSVSYALMEMYLQNKMELKYQEIKGLIKNQNDKIDRIEDEIHQQRKELFKKNRSNIMNEIARLRNEYQTQQDQTKKEEIKIKILSYETISMYMDENIPLGEIGARYLIINRYMGNFVDFFCKSGEDRTGRMQNLIEELCEFSRLHNKYPAYDFNEKLINVTDNQNRIEIAKNTSEYSVSRDINDANCIGARGLQIAYKLATETFYLNEKLPNKSGDLIGKMAKNSYKELPGIEADALNREDDDKIKKLEEELQLIRAKKIELENELCDLKVEEKSFHDACSKIKGKIETIDRDKTNKQTLSSDNNKKTQEIQEKLILIKSGLNDSQQDITTLGDSITKFQEKLKKDKDKARIFYIEWFIDPVKDLINFLFGMELKTAKKHAFETEEQLNKLKVDLETAQEINSLETELKEKQNQKNEIDGQINDFELQLESEEKNQTIISENLENLVLRSDFLVPEIKKCDLEIQQIEKEMEEYNNVSMLSKYRQLLAASSIEIKRAGSDGSETNSEVIKSTLKNTFKSTFISAKSIIMGFKHSKKSEVGTIDNAGDNNNLDDSNRIQKFTN